MVEPLAVMAGEKHDPATLIELIYALEQYTDKYVDQTFEARLEDTLYQWSLHYRDFETDKYIRWVIDNVEIFNQADRTYSPWLNDLNATILTDGTSPTTAIAAVKNQAQLHLDNIFNK